MTPRSKINYISILNVIAFSFLFFCCSSLKGQDVCSFIKNVQAYQDSIRIFPYDDSYEIDTLTFQLNSYMGMFDHLKKAPEQQFKIFYRYGGLDGDPKIYSIPKGFDIEDYIQEEIKKSGNKYKIYGDLKIKNLRDIILLDFINDSARRAITYLVPEDTSQGYLQYLFFYIMGEKFALFWHSLYSEKRILCTEQDKEYIKKRYFKNESFGVDTMELKKLDGIDLAPTIIITKSNCYITWYELETHNGLFKKTYEIHRMRPFKIQEVASTRILNIQIKFLY